MADASDSAAATSGGILAILGVLFDIGLIFGPHIGYVVQYYAIHTTRNIDGYSCLVSFILLVSNTIRVFYFWGGEGFALPLLFQSLLAIVMHLALIMKVLTLHEEAEQAAIEQRVFDSVATSTRFPKPFADGKGMNAGMQPSDATNGERESGNNPASPTTIVYARSSDDLLIYKLLDAFEDRIMAHDSRSFACYYCLWAVLGGVAALIFASFGNWAAVTLGYTALGIEAMLAVPQIIRNMRRGSTEGLTLVLVLSWVAGDAIKVVYFILMSQPLPFTICGCIQLALDFVVIGQLVYYRRSSSVLGALFLGGSSRPSSGGDEPVTVV